MYAFWSSGFNPSPLVGTSVRKVSNGFLWKTMRKMKKSAITIRTATV